MVSTRKARIYATISYIFQSKQYLTTHTVDNGSSSLTTPPPRGDSA